MIMDGGESDRDRAKVSGIPDATFAAAPNAVFWFFLLWVIWSYFEVGKKHRLSCGLLSFPVRFYPYDYRIILAQRFRVIRFCDPSPLRGVSFIKHSVIVALLPFRPSSSPPFHAAPL